MSAHFNPLRMIAASAILAVGVAILAYATSGSDVANRDYICYWTAGQQLVHHANPYDRQAIGQMEHAAGHTAAAATFMRNPPNAFFLIYPLGFFGERQGAIVWSLAIIASLMLSLRILMQSRKDEGLHLFVYFFPPVIACILATQVATFILLGLSLFLVNRERRPFLAGAALLLCTLKPHIFLPFGCVLLAWVITRRAWRVLAGAASALAGSLAFASLVDPQGWSQYARMMKSESLQNEFIPTVSLFFRLAIDRHAAWLQFVPAAVACLWALSYFRRHRAAWNWETHGSLVLFLSVMVAPYAWVTDEAVLVPAVLAGLYATARAHRSFLPFAILCAIEMLQIFTGVVGNSGWYLWTAPAWLIWYLLVTRSRSFPASERASAGELHPGVRGIAEVKIAR